MNISICKACSVDGKTIYFLEKINATPGYYELLRDRLKIKKIVGKNFVRLGRAYDGGYVMVDNFNTSSGIVYSFGINDDVSWDLEMAKRGCDVFMYDPTIDALPFNYEKFHFFKEGVLGIEIKEQHMNTLENFIKLNGHENKSNMILKMDVEGAEWSFLSTVTSEVLSKFDQILFEFHDLTKPKDQSVMNATLACISKINLDDKILFPDLLELTYVKTSNYELVDDENICLPIPLDIANTGVIPDIPLGYWNKKFNNVVKQHD